MVLFNLDLDMLVFLIVLGFFALFVLFIILCYIYYYISKAVNKFDMWLKNLIRKIKGGDKVEKELEQVQEQVQEQEPKGLGDLIDMMSDDFRSYCADQNLGMLCSIKNLLTLTYNEVNNVKSELVDKIGQDNLNELEKHTLQGLFSKLMLIEQKTFIVKELIEDREKSI